MPTSDPRVADLVQAGRLRMALFPPQLAKNADTGAYTGPWFEVAQALATAVGVALDVVELSNPAEVPDCLDNGGCDIASLGFDPTRADQVGGFTPPFMQMDYTYLVPAGSAIHCVADADQPGTRMATVSNHASTLALGRRLQHAATVIADTPAEAFELLRSGQADAWASIRPILVEFGARLPGSRVLDDGYGGNLPALVVAKRQDARLAYLCEFVEAAKASGAMAQVIARGADAGYTAAL